MIEDWIDNLCRTWDISDARLGQVRSYRLVSANDFPDAINALDLAVQPVALTIPGSMQAEYSMGGPLLGFYTGVTEFHVTQDLDRSRLPGLIPWYGKILSAAAGNLTLNGMVELFYISEAIEGPVALRYGDENPHWGFLVRWTVKERLNGLVVSA